MLCQEIRSICEHEQVEIYLSLSVRTVFYENMAHIAQKVIGLVIEVFYAWSM